MIVKLLLWGAGHTAYVTCGTETQDIKFISAEGGS